MEDCAFCKIITGEWSSYKIYEDDYVLAFLDIAQKEYGHTLVVPKKHFKNTLDCDEDYLQKVILAVQKIAKHYVENCAFNGVQIFNLNGEIAGQTVFHLHYHIVPVGDNNGDLPPTTPLEKQQQRLKYI